MRSASPMKAPAVLGAGNGEVNGMTTSSTWPLRANGRMTERLGSRKWRPDLLRNETFRWPFNDLSMHFKASNSLKSC